MPLVKVAYGLIGMLLANTDVVSPVTAVNSNTDVYPPPPQIHQPSHENIKPDDNHVVFNKIPPTAPPKPKRSEKFTHPAFINSTKSILDAYYLDAYYDQVQDGKKLNPDVDGQFYHPPIPNDMLQAYIKQKLQRQEKLNAAKDKNKDDVAAACATAGCGECECNRGSGTTACCSKTSNCPKVRDTREVADHFNLDLSFYKKYVMAAGGIPITGSAQVSDLALIQGAKIINRMCLHRPEACRYTADNGIHMMVMANYPIEVTTDVPEHSQMTDFWNERARGLGATCGSRVTSSAEENVLCYRADRYRSNGIFFHEFSHTFHLHGLKAIYPKLFQEIREIYMARNNGLFNDKYAETNEAEFFAEISGSYFGIQWNHPWGNTATEMKTNVPEIYDILAKVWGPVDDLSGDWLCPSEPTTGWTGADIVVNCDNFWWGGGPRDFDKNPYRPATVCTQSFLGTGMCACPDKTNTEDCGCNYYADEQIEQHTSYLDVQQKQTPVQGCGPYSHTPAAVQYMSNNRGCLKGSCASKADCANACLATSGCYGYDWNPGHASMRCVYVQNTAVVFIRANVANYPRAVYYTHKARGCPITAFDPADVLVGHEKIGACRNNGQNNIVRLNSPCGNTSGTLQRGFVSDAQGNRMSMYEEGECEYSRWLDHTCTDDQYNPDYPTDAPVPSPTADCGECSVLTPSCTAWDATGCTVGNCESWARSGECYNNPGYMLRMCDIQCCEVKGCFDTDHPTPPPTERTTLSPSHPTIVPRQPDPTIVPRQPCDGSCTRRGNRNFIPD